MQPEMVQAVYEEVGGRWYPVYRDLSKAPFWQERPFFNDFPKIIENARPVWHPAEAQPLLLTQLSAVYQTLILPDMLQQVSSTTCPPPTPSPRPRPAWSRRSRRQPGSGSGHPDRIARRDVSVRWVAA